MSGFFEICVSCKKTFTDRGAYEAHIAEHRAAKKTAKKPIEEIGDRIAAETALSGVLSGTSEDEALAEVRQVNGKKKKLISAGIEAATMTPEEVETRYAEEKKKGKVK